VNVVELGAGTGIFTRLLLDRREVKSILACEPSEGMRKGFQSAVPASDKVKLVSGIFSDVPAPDASADLLAIAQAFHWVGRKPEDHEAALREFARRRLWN
jgi:ubiquinone/menaquinone biosynthesis C-methylase UbiE